MILAVRDVSAGYGTVPVLRNISFTQQYGEVLGVVGHNGMGKTTLLRTIVGLLRTASGAIEFDGEPIEDLPAYRRSSAGIGYVPQGNLGFPDLSVAENLELARAMKGSCAHLTIEAVVGLFPPLAELLGATALVDRQGRYSIPALAVARRNDGGHSAFDRGRDSRKVAESSRPARDEHAHRRSGACLCRCARVARSRDAEGANRTRACVREAFRVGNPRSIRRGLRSRKGERCRGQFSPSVLAARRQPRPVLAIALLGSQTAWAARRADQPSNEAHHP
jgi:ABC-type sugar transport system ATPase subunit